VIATLNPAKGRELVAALVQVPFVVVPLGAWVAAALPGEGQRSYRDNALAKARAAARLTGALALADDSGLEVDALGGDPGVASARFGGPGLDDRDRCRLLLDRLAAVAPSQRGARFRCTIALASPDGLEETVEGVVEGRIAEAVRGDRGFGYDPIFLYPPLGRTFGELDSEAKRRVSHRGRALREAARRLVGR
jgi:XTP/dITP diphosphohydrolase